MCIFFTAGTWDWKCEAVRRLRSGPKSIDPTQYSSCVGGTVRCAYRSVHRLRDQWSRCRSRGFVPALQFIARILSSSLSLHSDRFDAADKGEDFDKAIADVKKDKED